MLLSAAKMKIYTLPCQANNDHDMFFHFAYYNLLDGLWMTGLILNTRMINGISVFANSDMSSCVSFIGRKFYTSTDTYQELGHSDRCVL